MSNKVIVDGQEYVPVVDKEAWDVLGYSLAQLRGTVDHLAYELKGNEDGLVSIRNARNFIDLYSIIAIDNAALRGCSWHSLKEDSLAIRVSSAIDALSRLSSNPDKLHQYGEGKVWDGSAPLLWINNSLIPLRYEGFDQIWEDQTLQSFLRIVMAEMLENALKYSNPKSGTILFEWKTSGDVHTIACTNPTSHNLMTHRKGSGQGKKILRYLARKIDGFHSLSWVESTGIAESVFMFPAKSTRP